MAARTNWWERGLVFAGWGVAALLALGALVGLFRGHGQSAGRPPPLVVARSTPAARTPQSSVKSVVHAPRATKTAVVRATRTPRATATPAASLTRCDQLRGSRDWTSNDREWFFSNCLGSAAGRVTQPSLLAPRDGSLVPTAQPQRTDAPPEPTATPTPAGSASAAIALAVHWLGNDAPVLYSAAAGSCAATPIGGAWGVTCRATLAGCAEVGTCSRNVSLCVVLEPPRVDASPSC